MFSHFKHKKALKEQEALQEQARREEEEAAQARVHRRQNKPDNWGREPGSDKEWSWDKATSHRSHRSDDEDDDSEAFSPKTTSRRKNVDVEERRRSSQASSPLEPPPDSPSEHRARALSRRPGRHDLAADNASEQSDSVEEPTRRKGKERRRSSSPSPVYEPTARRSDEQGQGRSAFKP